MQCFLGSPSLLPPSESFIFACELREDICVFCVDLMLELLNNLHIVPDNSCALKRLSLKISWLPLGLLIPYGQLSMTACQVPEQVKICPFEVQACSTLCLAHSSQEHEYHNLIMVFAFLRLHIISLLLTICEYRFQQCTSPNQFIHCIHYKFEKSPGLLETLSGAFAAQHPSFQVSGKTSMHKI